MQFMIAQQTKNKADLKEKERAQDIYPYRAHMPQMNLNSWSSPRCSNWPCELFKNSLQIWQTNFMTKRECIQMNTFANTNANANNNNEARRALCGMREFDTKSF